MTESRVYAIASEFDVAENAIEILFGLGYDENTIRYIIKTGIEAGKIKTIDDYELELLFGIHHTN